MNTSIQIKQRFTSFNNALDNAKELACQHGKLATIKVEGDRYIVEIYHRNVAADVSHHEPISNSNRLSQPNYRRDVSPRTYFNPLPDEILSEENNSERYIEEWERDADDYIDGYRQSQEGETDSGWFEPM